MTEISSTIDSRAVKQIGMMSQPDIFSFGRLEIARQSLPALRCKFQEAEQCTAEEVVIWGSGKTLGEFLHWNNPADALVLLLKTCSESDHINVGSGTEMSIRELAPIIAQVVRYEGSLTFDTSKPDEAPRKLMDGSKLHQPSWNKARDLQNGARETFLPIVGITNVE